MRQNLEIVCLDNGIVWKLVLIMIVIFMMINCLGIYKQITELSQKVKENRLNNRIRKL
jgi:cell division protein FtsL